MTPAPLVLPTKMVPVLMTFVPAPRNSVLVPPPLSAVPRFAVMGVRLLSPTSKVAATMVFVPGVRRSCASGRAA